MPIRAFLQSGIYDDQQTKILKDAFEEALRIAKISDRNDPKAEFIARHVVRSFETGERDPQKLASHAAAAL